MNKEHVEILLSGVEKWNKWRKNNPEIIPNLHGANLRDVDLYGANLQRANLWGANLWGADLRGADLRDADLYGANLQRANLRDADLQGADLSCANLRGADLRGADLSCANLRHANLQGADLQGANLQYADLQGADLSCANLRGANLQHANLYGANLRDADLWDAKGLKKQMNVQPGDIYWKRFEAGLCNMSYQYYVGINKLRENEVFAADERIMCSYPGFHFASRSWCAANYPDRPLEAKIRIPAEAKINEPWATDGKASADMIEILQVFDVATNEDVTDEIPPEQIKPIRLITGYDLLELGFMQGKIFKVIFSDIEDKQLEGMINLKEEAIRYIQENYNWICYE